MYETDAKRLTLGHIGGATGLKGWLKVKSYTDPVEAVCDYQPWYVVRQGTETLLNVSDYVVKSQALLVKLRGIDDRNAAEFYRSSTITVDKSVLPPLPKDDFYWHQLIGLRVVHVGHDRVEQLLGRVSSMLETGANDVMVVDPCEGSVDAKQRLIPYVFGIYVLEVGLEIGEVKVDWSPEF